MFLIDNFLIWLAKELEQFARQEMNDESKLKEQLLESQALYELGQISEEEFQKREDRILARMEAIRKEKTASQ